MAGVSKLREEFRVVEVHIGDGVVERVSLLISSAVGIIPDNHFLELHDVASEGACFVTEYILDLTQLLIEI